MPRWRWFSVSVFLCFASAAAPVGAAPSRGPANEVGRTPSSCEPLQPGTQAVNVHWSSIRTRTPGCFFFSGPGRLGRDTPLGTSATLDWGARQIRLSFPGAAFSGTRATPLSLTRQSTHAFDGTWTVTERMAGDRVRVGASCEGLRLAYSYEECHDGDPCPGQCHIDAILTVTAR